MSPKHSFLYGLILSSLLLAGCAGLLPVSQSTPAANPTTTEPTATSTTTLTPGPLDLSAGLSELTGVVDLKNPDQADFSAAFDGMRLVLQGQVRTGSNGRARLDLSSGTIVRMAPDSLFTLQSNEEQDGSLLTRLMMEAGEIWIILNSGRMDVETPSGTASVRGSFLHVKVDPFSSDVQVTCLEGACQAENPNSAVEMIAGEGAALNRLGSRRECTTASPPGALSQPERDR